MDNIRLNPAPHQLPPPLKTFVVVLVVSNKRDSDFLSRSLIEWSKRERREEEKITEEERKKREERDSASRGRPSGITCSPVDSRPCAGCPARPGYMALCNLHRIARPPALSGYVGGCSWAAIESGPDQTRSEGQNMSNVAMATDINRGREAVPTRRIHIPLQLTLLPE